MAALSTAATKSGNDLLLFDLVQHRFQTRQRCIQRRGNLLHIVGIHQAAHIPNQAAQFLRGFPDRRVRDEGLRAVEEINRAAQEFFDWEAVDPVEHTFDRRRSIRHLALSDGQSRQIPRFRRCDFGGGGVFDFHQFDLEPAGQQAAGGQPRAQTIRHS